MDLQKAIASIDAAEELFALLEVAFKPAVLAVHRIALLRRFGQEVTLLERRCPPLSEGERKPLYAAALERAHTLFARGGGEVEPFLSPRPRGLVPVERARRVAGRVGLP